MFDSIARPAVLVAALSLIPTGAALAGPIILENNAGPNVCEVQVSVGPDAPNGPIQTFGGLDFNWRQEIDADRLCYRVSVPPENCSGSFTDWRCCEAAGGESLCAIE